VDKQNILNSEVKKFLEDSIFPELERGRPGWDKPHTQAVVHHAHRILAYAPDVDVDREVIIIAAYAHDWGYADLFSPGKYASYKEVKERKKLHMEIGARKIAYILQNPIFDYLSSTRKDRTVHLVAKHDKLSELRDTDELVLLEADTLGMLDVDFAAPTFDHSSNEQFMNGVMNSRVPRFITEYSKNKVKELLKKRGEYYRRLLAHSRHGS
jgi:hypothetical protein